MDWAELRAKLVKRAIHFGAPEPEDAAHTIILRLPMGKEPPQHPDGFWWTSAKRVARDQQKWWGYRTMVDPEALWDKPKPSEPIGFEIPLDDPDVQRMLEHSERDRSKPMPSTERGRVNRCRKRLRERYGRCKSGTDG